MASYKYALFLAAALTAFSGPIAAEDVCQLPNVDAFLDQCPTNDPALGQILRDFTITNGGVPVTFDPSACHEPVSGMPIAQYTDELSLLQTLRAIYYLDRGRCGHLPWTPLSLYDWLGSKVAGFNFDPATTMDNCCGTYPNGRFYVNLRVNDDTNRAYHRTWEGVAEWLGLLMHEARHVDGFGHVSCCGIPGGCDQQYDETNLSPYGIQYWLEKSFVDGTIHTGYTCLSPSRTAAIKNWLRQAANDRPSRFCNNPPPQLTDANNPPPACDQRCATSVSCVAQAFGVPPNGGPPNWWSPSPPQPVYHDQLDDPRWAGASKITYGDGTGEKAEFRALHSGGYLYLSWRALVAPASTADQNVLYFGYRRAGGGDVIVTVALNSLAAATASPTQLNLAAFLRNADGTQGAPVTLPPEIQATARVWVDPSPPGSWAVQLQLPIAALNERCGRFHFWYELLAGTPTVPVVSFTWPRTGADIDGGTVASPHALVFPDPETWNWLRPNTGLGDSQCSVAGVSLDYTNIGTTNTPASKIQFRPTAPFPSNTFFARPTNHSDAAIPAGAITATFRLANWGSVPGDWEANVPVDQLWSPIPGGTDVPTSGPIPVGATADASSESHFSWTVADPDLSQFVSGARRSHQCMLVELKRAVSLGVTFANSSVYRNMDVVSASRFERDALLSIKGLAPAPAGSRDVYLYIETRNMPARVKDRRPSEVAKPPRNIEGMRVREGELQETSGQELPTYRAHVYHDSGKVLTIGGTVRPVLGYQTSFGYQVTHQGEIEGWRHQINGPGLMRLASDWYRVNVANDGAVSVTTTIDAVEPRPIPFWLWLLIMLFLALIVALWYLRRRGP